MILLLAAFAVVGLALVAFGARLGRRAFLVGALPMAATAAWVATRLPDVTDGTTRHESVGWVGGLGLAVDLHLDGFATTMTLIVTVVGVAVLLYASRYFAPDARDLGRLAGLLVLFAGSMVGLVLADHVIVLYACWELTSITSFLLIGNRHDQARARAAALHALLVTGAGGLALLGGLVLLGQAAGTYRLEGILAAAPSGTAVTVALVLVLVGACTKSAQYPFHAWLPGAMAAPTPVSAYLHSATMVKAGVFLVARLAPVFATQAPWRPVVLAAGCATLVFGGLRALRQHDLKLLLAFGTVSQLGLMMVLFGAGTPATTTAGWVLLIAHAAFKCTLFMVVGVIDHQSGTRDIRKLPALRDGWRPLELVALLALVSMAGIPLGAGFVAKELSYEALDEATFLGHEVVLVAAIVGSMLTVAYATRFYTGAFAGPRRRAAGEPAPLPGETHRDPSPTTELSDPTLPIEPVDPVVVVKPRAHALTNTTAEVAVVDPDPAPPAPSFVAPAAALALVGVVLGVVPGLGDKLATVSLEDFRGSVPAVHLAVWHGFGAPLLYSALTLAGGFAIWAADRRVRPRLAWASKVPSGAEVYLAALRALGIVSTRVTGFVQNGSLPVYAGVIAATAAALPVAALLAGWDWPGWPRLGPKREAPVVIVLLTAALGAALVRKRFSAAIFLGVVGYAMAGLFVLSGAPDLALTQAAVETLSTVVFVLVLRNLPERFERQSTPGRRIGRLLIAAGVAAAVFVLALTSAGVRLGNPVSEEMVDRAVPDGHGRNVVNVILVDFRGFDTAAEITVLTVASIGAVALARAGRRRRDGEPVPAANTEEVRRLVFVDVSVRVVFHAVLMLSLWLLFAGHNQPGGGFVGGLLAGSAIALRYVAGGIDEVRGRARFRPWTVLGTGLLLSSSTVAAPLLFGGAVLESAVASLDLPLVGEVDVNSALAFDVGVYLVVIGMVLMAFEAFGEEPKEVAPR
ncbi:MAG TPA: hydrogen gas-evolving membrane-bound hydrogenase subunit E [Acidimicrobiales bacterium]